MNDRRTIVSTLYPYQLSGSKIICSDFRTSLHTLRLPLIIAHQANNTVRPLGGAYMMADINTENTQRCPKYLQASMIL